MTEVLTEGLITVWSDAVRCLAQHVHTCIVVLKESSIHSMSSYRIQSDLTLTAVLTLYTRTCTAGKAVAVHSITAGKAVAVHSIWILCDAV